MSKILEEELKERLHLKKLERLAASFSGACISNGFAFNTDDEKGIFVKTNASLNAEIMFSGELLSLKAISATKCIKVPEGITVITNYDDKKTSAIVMQFLKMVPLSGESSRKLGSDLANLHDYNNKLMKFQDKAVRWIGNQQPSIKHLIADRKQISIDSDEITYSKHSIRARNENKEDASLAGKSDRFLPQPGTEVITKFGFDVPTSCGSVPQVNEWTSDWVAFYARHRLDVTIRSLLSEHSDRELHESWSHLQLKIDKLFDDFKYKGSGEGEITPSLLHGDLWSGNAAQLSESSDCVVYDPASFYGHAEYDLAIARMFGGFSHEFETAYFDALPKAKNIEKRNKLYQLFHHLNHWNHFGSGYRSSSLNLMKSLLKSTS